MGYRKRMARQYDPAVTRLARLAIAAVTLSDSDPVDLPRDRNGVVRALLAETGADRDMLGRALLAVSEHASGEAAERARTALMHALLHARATERLAG